MNDTSFSNQVYRVNRTDLNANPVVLPPYAGVFVLDIGALARDYFGAIDAGDINEMLLHLDPNGFNIQVFSPNATLETESGYREWYRAIDAKFSRRQHTVLALDARMITSESAQASLYINSELERRNPAEDQQPRVCVSLGIIWDLTRIGDGKWVISSQREANIDVPEFSTERARGFGAAWRIEYRAK